MMFWRHVLNSVGVLLLMALVIFTWTSIEGTLLIFLGATIGFVFGNIEAVSRFKASISGVEAETREVIRDAKDTLRELRRFAKGISSTFIIMLNAHGRLNGINKDAVTEKTLASLRQLGLDEQEIEEVRSEARPFVLFDYVSAIARNVARENLTSEQNQKWRDFSGDRLERIGREVPPDDLKNLLASIDLLNEERLALIEDYHYYWINTRHRRPEVWERRGNW